MYEVDFNISRGVWQVWKLVGAGAWEVVKSFKTQAAAERWIEKHR